MQKLNNNDKAFDIWTLLMKQASYIGDIGLYIVVQKQALKLIENKNSAHYLHIKKNIYTRVGKLLEPIDHNAAFEYLQNAVMMLDDLFGDGESQYSIPDEADEDLELYNAFDDIKRVLGEGGTSGVHSIVLYNTVAALRMTKCTRPENFNHRIAFAMSPEDAGDFLSKAALIKDAEGRIIGNEIAVYDGGVRDIKFMPFILEE